MELSSDRLQGEEVQSPTNPRTSVPISHPPFNRLLQQPSLSNHWPFFLPRPACSFCLLLPNVSNYRLSNRQSSNFPSNLSSHNGQYLCVLGDLLPHLCAHRVALLGTDSPSSMFLSSVPSPHCTAKADPNNNHRAGANPAAATRKREVRQGPGRPARQVERGAQEEDQGGPEVAHFSFLARYGNDKNTPRTALAGCRTHATRLTVLLVKYRCARFRCLWRHNIRGPLPHHLRQFIGASCFRLASGGMAG